MGFAGKNKREAGEAIEKIVSAKKQKKNDGVAQAVTKVKVETKTQKKKKAESSDSDDSSSEEEVQNWFNLINPMRFFMVVYL